MQVVYSEAHFRHQPPEVISRGRGQPHVEVARRAEALIAAARRDGHEILAPAEYGGAPRAAVHSPDYLAFLEEAWREWQALPDPTPVVQPHASPGRHMTGRPTGIVGRAGWYVTTNSAPIVEGTWSAACAATDVAVHAAELVMEGASAVYALCRPPGHHAFADTAGGFCYFNNVAVAAERLRRRFPRVAILDIDVHHGNGTQGIFYRRPDVFFVSLHGDPSDFFPFFAGYGHERGEDAGRGFNLNLAMPPGTADSGFLETLDTGLAAIRRFVPDVLLVSLGFDAYELDPIGILKVTTGGFGEVARRIGGLDLPTVLVQEGGYNCDALGANLSSFLNGFEASRRT